MSDIHSHRDLLVWQKAVDLALEIYAICRSLPESERFGLIAQLRRAAVSVASNIAEGYGRGSTADYIRFLRAARGSLYEIDTQLLIACRLEYVQQSAYEAVLKHVNEVGRMLAGLIRTLEQGSKS